MEEGAFAPFFKLARDLPGQRKRLKAWGAGGTMDHTQ